MKNMPHQRPRLILSLLEKRLNFFPIVGVLGARQTGKSTLMRELLSQRRKIRYVTLDREEIRLRAEKQPTLFIQGLEEKGIATVCIDEVQKAPKLFDTLKAEIDEKKRPGRFAISGSTEFSKKTGVRESLTGRITLLTLFPLNIAELELIKPTFPLVKDRFLERTNTPNFLKHITRWTQVGGMPGIFGTREELNRTALFEAWVEVTCTRDLAQFQIPRFNPDLARRIFFATASADNPIRPEIARLVGRTPRQIEPYFQAFKSLFVFYEIEPHRTGVGKSLFYIFDSGVAHFSGSNEARCRQIWFLNECFSQFSYAGQMRPSIFHYHSSRNSQIDFVIQTRNSERAFQIVDLESPGTYELRASESFHRTNKQIPVCILAPCLSVQKVGKMTRIVPWSYIVG